MKSVTIKNQSGWGPFEEVYAKHGFTISCIDGEKEAAIFDSAKEESSKLIPKSDFDKLWNKLMKVHFQKVLLENEPYQGCDGDFSIVELSVGLQSLTLSLWCPDEDFYEENNFSESLKLVNVVKEIVKFANSHNIAVGFKFVEEE